MAVATTTKAKGTDGIDWAAFCLKHDAVYEMRHAFVRGGWKYATDGKACIRAAAPGEPDTVSEGRDYAPAWSLFDRRPEGQPDPAVWEPWPAVADYIIGPIDCGRCKGEGWYEKSGQRCRVCKGRGKVEGPAYQAVGTRHIAARYDRAIRVLAGARFWCQPGERPPEYRGNPPAPHPVWFAFDGGEGVVMPVQVTTAEASR